MHQKFPKCANLMNYRKFTQNERRNLIFITVFITDPPFFHHGFITEKTLQSPIRKAFQEVGFSFFIADSSPMPHFFITVFITVHTIIYRKNVIRRMYKKKERRKRRKRKKKETRTQNKATKNSEKFFNFFLISGGNGEKSVSVICYNSSRSRTEGIHDRFRKALQWHKSQHPDRRKLPSAKAEKSDCLQSLKNRAKRCCRLQNIVPFEQRKTPSAGTQRHLLSSISIRFHIRHRPPLLSVLHKKKIRTSCADRMRDCVFQSTSGMV